MTEGEEEKWERWGKRFVWLELRLILVFLVSILVGINVLYLNANDDIIMAFGVVLLNEGLLILTFMVIIMICYFLADCHTNGYDYM